MLFACGEGPIIIIHRSGDLVAPIQLPDLPSEACGPGSKWTRTGPAATIWVPLWRKQLEKDTRRFLHGLLLDQHPTHG